MSPPNGEGRPLGDALTEARTGQGSETRNQSNPRRLTANGLPSLTPEYERRLKGRTFSTLAAQLVDPELAAERLLEELGPAACARLGRALVAISREVS